MIRRKSAAAALAFAFALGAAAAAAGQDAATADFESALFSGGGEAGQGFADAAAAGNEAAGRDASRIDYLVGGTVSARASAAGVPADGLTAISGVSGKLLAKVSVPDYGALFVSYAASYPFLQGVAGDAAAAADDVSNIAYSLSELHYSFDIGKAVFIRVGRQLIAWGPSAIWTPVDFINGEKADSFADLDLRTGKNGLRVHAPLGRANVFAFADFSGMNDDGFYGDIADTMRFGGRLDFTAADFEWGFSAYAGREAQARAGFDFSGRILGTTVYGETALAPGYESYGRTFQAALGFSRALGELKRWTLSAEGFYNSTGADRTGLTAESWLALDESARPAPLYEGRFYAYAALASARLGSPYLSGKVYAIANLDDGSFVLRAATSFGFPRSVPFTLELSYSGGGGNKEFTRFPGNGALGAALSTKIAF